MIVGCSTSEVAGEPIGTTPNMQIAERIYDGIKAVLNQYSGIFLAVQCCEHLNRTIIIEKELRKKLNIPEVNVVPHLKAGGAFATCAYKKMNDACVVESISAQWGLDIGEVFIGMHMQEVVVPLKLPVKYIGKARVKACYSRRKYIGGERAKYAM